MTTPVASNIIHIPADLIKDPTSLDPSTAPDFGGTILGNVSEVVLRVTHRQEALRAEEYANEVVEVVEGSDDVVLGAFLRGFDKDAIQTIFRDADQSSLTGQARVQFPGATTRASSFGSDRAIKLLLAAKNYEEHPSLIIYNAIPLLDEAAQLRFSFNNTNEYGLPVVFQGIRDSSAKIAQHRLLEDLDLS